MSLRHSMLLLGLVVAALCSPAVGQNPLGPPTKLNAHKESINAVACSPDGKTLATTSDDHTVKLWDLATKTETATLVGHDKGVLSLAFAPDGKTLATGSEDETARLWDLATRKVRATLKGHGFWVASVAFS